MGGGGGEGCNYMSRISHLKGGERLRKTAQGREDAGENFKGGRRFSFIREEGVTVLFKTFVREAGGKPVTLREEGG